MNFDNYQFRCSQLSKICAGTIGLTKKQKIEVEELIEEKKTGLNKNGNKIKWTTNKQDKLDDLEFKAKNIELPLTMQTELKKIHRAETFNRNFIFTTKYVQKGIKQEEEGVSTFQEYRNKIQKIPTLFLTNSKVKIRLYNEHITGEPDLVDTNDFKNCKEGFDIKCPWSLETLPFQDDELSQNYYWQNQGYMWLTGADIWHTVYTLVNASEEMLHKEKLKWYYALETGKHTPDSPESPYYDEYISKCKDVEKMMIFDYDKFVKDNNHIMEHTRAEWMEGGYDIPLEDRVVIKTVERDTEAIEFLQERVILAREYLKNLK
jgi:hypothetical protein